MGFNWRVKDSVSLLITLAAVIAASPVSAQTPERSWSFYATANIYFVPDSEDFLQPTIAADRGALHLEGRVNNEYLDTGSAWIGYNLSMGDAIAFAFTPMFGVVFGGTTAIASGYQFTLSWRWLEVYSDTEFVLNRENDNDSFLYTWSEVSIAPAGWWRAGVVIERSKAYKTAFEIQRGPLAGVLFGPLDVTAYLLNPEDPTFVIAIGIAF